MIAAEATIRTDSPAPSRQLIEREKREQFTALDHIRRILSENAAPQHRPRSLEEEMGELCWARGIHQPARRAR